MVSQACLVLFPVCQVISSSHPIRLAAFEQPGSQPDREYSAESSARRLAFVGSAAPSASADEFAVGTFDVAPPESVAAEQAVAHFVA